MKKIILAVLMTVMISTPCFSQQVEPDGIFSLHGTSWKAIVVTPYAVGGRSIGFYEGKVYPYLRLSKPPSFYIDLGVVSFFMSNRSFYYGIGIMTGVVQPIGFGLATWAGFGYAPPAPIVLFQLWVLIKASDNWSPEQDIQEEAIHTTTLNTLQNLLSNMD